MDKAYEALVGNWAAIVGDMLYSGIPAPRLMLHASELVFTHPISGQQLKFESSAEF